MKKQFIVATIVIFVLLSVIFYILKIYTPAYRFVALETANVVMAALSLSAYIIVRKQMNNRPQDFVRGVYGSSFLKLMVCMVSMLVYILLNRANIHKPSVFIMFGIYAVYTVMETWLLSKMAKD